jgi:hypothetical protein
MREKTPQRSRLLQFFVCAWMAAAQIWYYAQFKEQFRSMFSIALRRLWH